jgi:hypothetical protein
VPNFVVVAIVRSVNSSARFVDVEDLLVGVVGGAGNTCF